MHDLIHITSAVIGGASVQSVNARDLHVFFEVTTAFKDWIARRIADYGFTEGQDFCSFLSESSGGRPGREYGLTLDMAKELAMVERTEKGKQARQYFIDCERAAKGQYRIAANDDLVIAETISRSLRLDGSAHLGMMRRAVEMFAPRHMGLLPAYSVDSPKGSQSISAEETYSLAALLKMHGLNKSSAAVNKQLQSAGILEQRQRKSSKMPTETKRFWVITQEGLRFGKNLVSDKNPRETQPHWYRSTFAALLEELAEAEAQRRHSA